jgi:hypothetical protein
MIKEFADNRETSAVLIGLGRLPARCELQVGSTDHPPPCPKCGNGRYNTVTCRDGVDPPSGRLGAAELAPHEAPPDTSNLLLPAPMAGFLTFTQPRSPGR